MTGTGDRKKLCETFKHAQHQSFEINHPVHIYLKSAETIVTPVIILLRFSFKLKNNKSAYEPPKAPSYRYLSSEQPHCLCAYKYHLGVFAWGSLMDLHQLRSCHHSPGRL